MEKKNNNMLKKEKQSVKNKKLSRITTTSIFIAVLFILLVIIANDNVQTALNKRAKLIDNAVEFREASRYLTNEIREYAVTTKQEHSDNYLYEVDVAKRRDNAITAMKKIGLSDNEIVLLDEVKGISDNLVPLEEQAIEYVKNGDLSSAIQNVYSDEYQLAMDEIGNKTDEFIDLISARMNRKGIIASWIGFILELIILIFLIFTLFIQRKYTNFVKVELVKPIQEIEKQMITISKGNLNSEFNLEEDTETEIGRLIGAIKSTKSFLVSVIGDLKQKMEKLAVGDLRIDVELDYIGDFKEIKDSLQTIVSSMNDMFKNLKEVLHQVSVGAEQASLNAQNLAESSSMQSQAIERIASNIEKFNSLVNENSKFVIKTEDSSVEISRNLQEGNEKILELNSAMILIKDCMEAIVGITDTIDDIANQTDLLAINAAIEAAKANESGKGFAVVAEQVKVLALDCSSQASKTAELISKTVNAITKGMILSDDTVKILHKLEGLENYNLELMNEILDATDIQAKKITEIKNDIDGIVVNVQTNLSVSGENATASEEQNIQSETLNNLIKKFKLKD